MDATKTNVSSPVYAATDDDDDRLVRKLEELPFLVIALAIILYDSLRTAAEKLPPGGYQNLTAFYLGSTLAIMAFPSWKWEILALASIPFSAAVCAVSFFTIIETCDLHGDYGFEQDSENWKGFAVLFFLPTAALAALAALR